MKFIFALILFALISAGPSYAQGTDSVHKDSLYFTMDDGIQSPEEMVEEADYILGMCQTNAYQKLYFNCECLAGAFLQQREKLGPLALQQDILDQLTKSSRATCANTEAIAGSTYENCMKRASISREFADDNEEYCQCAANKVANDFARSPRLDSRYIRNVKSRAMLFCNTPSNRPAHVQSKTSN